MIKMISAPNETINVQPKDLKMLVSLIAGIATTSVLLQYLVIEINTYNIFLMLFITILVLSKKLTFFGHVFIGVILEFVD